MPDLNVSLGRLILKNPVLVAAGTFGYGLEFARTIPLKQLGGLILKTITRHPREGNPPPRLIETPSGLLNAVGLQNVGLNRLIADYLPQLKNHDVPVIVSILGESPKELAEMVGQLDPLDVVRAIELNLSCPNVKQTANPGPPTPSTGAGSRQPAPAKIRVGPGQAADSRFVGLVAHDAEASFEMVKHARQQTDKPLIAKLSPDVTDLRPVAQAVERAGADAVAIANTFVGMSLDPGTCRSRLGTLTGGLSGPAIRPLIAYRVWYTAQTLHIPIIGLGGIVRPEDALEFLFAGASAVGIGTANFANPKAALAVIRGIERFLSKRGIASVRELRGGVWDGIERRAAPFEQ